MQYKKYNTIQYNTYNTLQYISIYMHHFQKAQSAYNCEKCIFLKKRYNKQN